MALNTSAKEGVSGHREWVRGTPCYLGLGSNLGDRLGYLRHALRLLPGEGVTVTRCSAVYETEPWGLDNQPRFLNMACEVRTDLSPEALLVAVKRVERRVGRTPPSERYGPREIDIDLLLYGEVSVARQDLEVPHPRMAERAFVLVPLTDLAPDLRHPVLGQTMEELLAHAPDREGVRPWTPPPL